jgi:hypothetical protein
VRGGKVKWFRLTDTFAPPALSGHPRVGKNAPPKSTLKKIADE